VLVTNNAFLASLFAQRDLQGTKLMVQSYADPLIDFYLLTRSRELAIGTSSFGWWAGWLNETASTVFAPDRRKWFSFLARNDPYWDTTDLYSARFTQVGF
jgi:hypothetical protein